MLYKFSFKRSIAIINHYLNSLKRNPMRIIDVFFWPAFELTIFVFLVAAIQSSNNNSLRLVLGLLSGVVFWYFFSRIVQEITAQFLDDVYSKNVLNILITPISWFEILVGLVIASFIKLVLSISVLAFILYFLYPEFLKLYSTNAILLLIPLIFFAISVGILFISLILLYGNRMGVLGMVITIIIQPFACVFYPRSILPTLFYKLSYLVPPSYVFESMRTFLQYGQLSAYELNYSYYLTVSYFVLSIIIFKILFNLARKTGSIVKL